MIYRIYSSLSSFKEISFHEGFNILVADKSEGATDRQTRNGAGKTSLIEIIHFLLGASCPSDSIFSSKELRNYYFGMEFELGQNRVTVERSGNSSRNIVVVAGKTSDWPVRPVPQKETGQLVVSNSDWRRILGYYFFRIQLNTSDESESEDTALQRPSFRSLFAYFVRRQEAGAFMSPIKQSSFQQIGDQQIAVTYLLNLDWSIPAQWQQIRAREKTLRELKKAVGEGTLGEVIKSAAELRTKVALSEERSKRMQANLAEFQVLPEYREIEREASSISADLGRLADENTIDEQLIIELDRIQTDEQSPPYDEVQKVYKEAGVLLSDAIRVRFEEVKAFHDSVVQNRLSYFASERSAAMQRIESRRIELERLATRYQTIMRLLHTHGALDQYSLLQAEYARVEAETTLLRQQFDIAQQLESQKGELEIERAQLQLRLRRDYSEREIQLKNAILSFEEVSSSLYENAGSLTIQESMNGPVFEFVIPGAKSRGISNMQIFCFDMMLMQMLFSSGMGLDFLVHDSHLFDGVDQRQIAKALQVGTERAQNLKFQYLVTINSDILASVQSTGMDTSRYELSVRLTDATNSGGLFGIRFR